MNELVLVERDELLGELLDLAVEGFAGHGRLVFLGGEAGVGKTSLVHMLTAAVADRCILRMGAVDNLTTADPLAAYRDALPELPFTADDDRLQWFRSIREELSSRPTLLVLEDLHWADEATLDALRFLGRRLDGMPALVVATYRRDEVPPRHPLSLVMGDLAGLVGVRRMSVPPLSVAGVALLVAESAAELDPVAVHARTEGNAFFVTEVLSSDDRALPATVRDAVLARTARLSDAAADVAAAAAILGTAVSIDLLTAVTGRPVAGVDECVEHGVLVAGADGLFSFRHELAREAVERSLSAVQRRSLHQHALQRLSVLEPTDHRTLAHHALGAGEAAQAVDHALAAAKRAARLGAHREAAAEYRLALRAVPEDHLSTAERAAMFEALAYECYLTDQLPEAISAEGRALDLFELGGDRLHVGDGQRWLSRLVWFMGRNEDAERHGARAVETLEPLGDSHELAMAYSNVAQLRMLANDDGAAQRWGERALDLARRLGDREVEIHVLNNLGTALSHAGRRAEGEALLRRSLDLALAADAHEHAARAYTNLGSGAAAQRRYRDALPALGAGIAYCTDRDLDSWTRYMQSWQVVTLAELGTWDEAIELSTRLLAHPAQTPITVIPAASAAARIQARRGLDASANLALASTLAAATGELQRIAPAAGAESEAAWLAGRADAIPAFTARALDLVGRHHDPWVLGEMLWWCSLVPGWEGPKDGQVAEPYALMLAGRWADAAAAWEALGMPVWQAYSLGLDGDTGAAQRAIAILERLGAAAAVEALLRTRAERGLPLSRRPRAATRANAGQLTGRELDILLVLAEGFSTAEIAGRLVLSPRTVEHHVSAILRKLDEPTRGRAVAAARRLGVLDSPTS